MHKKHKLASDAHYWWFAVLFGLRTSSSQPRQSSQLRPIYWAARGDSTS